MTRPCVASYVGLALRKHRNPLEETGFGRDLGPWLLKCAERTKKLK